VLHGLFHARGACNNCGGHAWSRNGLDWHWTGIAYGPTVQYTDGTAFTFSRRERPHLIMDQAGKPIASQPLWFLKIAPLCSKNRHWLGGEAHCAHQRRAVWGAVWGRHSHVAPARCHVAVLRATEFEAHKRAGPRATQPAPGCCSAAAVPSRGLECGGPIV
jgi:hypothetical protein